MARQQDIFLVENKCAGAGWQQRTVGHPESYPGPLLLEMGAPLTFNANGEAKDGICLQEKHQVLWRHPLMSAKEAEVSAATCLNWGNDNITVVEGHLRTVVVAGKAR